MQITVTFNSLEEMNEFITRTMVGLDNPEKTDKPVPNPAPTASTPVPVQALPATTPAAAAPVQAAVPVTPTPVSMPGAQSLAASVSPAVTQTPPPAPTTQVPTTTAAYTADDLARAAMALMDSGHQQDLIGLLQQFGVNALPALRPEQYGAFATALRGMGAQI